ncbi:Transferase [Sesbania bispinosa]|nr:Transferase [Sesbania bispinosa]
MAEPTMHKLVEQCQISPTTTRTMSLPLTFLDLPLAGPIYVKRQFFYQFQYPTHHFYETTLPTLKHSLSLTLQYFFPLAGNLICPPPPQKPFIRCTDDDSVNFTIIESASDFNHLSANHPKSLKEFNHLVPKLTYTMVDDDDTFIFPLASLQASIFPNLGLCIAITEVLKDHNGLEAIFLRGYFEERSTWKERLVDDDDEDDFVKATVVFGRDDIEGMKRLVLNEWRKNDEFSYAPQYLSKFVVTCAFVWASLVKTRYRNDDDQQEESDHVKEEYFRFAADCRDRLEYPIPATYFGNCLTLCHGILTRKDLKGEGGFVKAVKVIEKAVTEMKNEPFKDADEWRASFKKMFVLGSVLLVTGSPKFTVYETDFGFGRPTKVEMVHGFKCMSLAESGDKEGGLEVGMVLRNNEFGYFSSFMEQVLKALKS